MSQRPGRTTPRGFTWAGRSAKARRVRLSSGGGERTLGALLPAERKAANVAACAQMRKRWGME